ncbi:MAG: NUDIX domain-containing protein [Actinomycetia bacterium]|nr:NUDIX domain-containing protein [Actinomycetes bacterium]MCP4958693.1 NUDIX domain-containing protein [Actinomycetes bacterium]
MAAQLSVGLLLYRPTGSTGPLEFLIAKMGGPFWTHKHEHSWTIPKGIAEAADPDELAVAEREFAEEMGSFAPIGDTIALGSVKSGNKTITIFAREGDFDATSIRSNTFELEWPPRSGAKRQFPEVERADWVSADEARLLLTKNQTMFIDRLLDAISIRPPSLGPNL